jgi:hypothetical protein
VMRNSSGGEEGVLHMSDSAGEPQASTAEVTAPAEVLTAAPLSGVRGWLLFFVITLTVLNPAATVAGQWLSWSQVASLFDRLPGLLFLSAVNLLVAVALASFSVYAGVALWRRKVGAVHIARVFLIVGAIYALISPFFVLLVGLPASANGQLAAGALESAGRGVLYYALWLTYLLQSKRVRATYPDAWFPPDKPIQRNAGS